jgi:ABC-type antimicrobial peptide transport system permease subunit
VFAVTALFLAAIGVYGVMTYAVSQRTGEIGIRMALGAQRGDVMRLILRQGARMVGLGLVAGLAGALAMTHLLTSMLYEVSPTDPLTLAVNVVVLSAVAMLACWLPARRATKVDPLVALRYE